MKTSRYNSVGNKKQMSSKVIDISGRDKNFGLTKSEYEDLSLGLKNGEEQLFETIFLSHFESCKGYIMGKYNISIHEAYDITMDTMIDFRQLIILDKIKFGNLRYLFTKMAGQRLGRSKKKDHVADLKEYYNIEEHEDKEHLFDVLSIAWKVLDKETQSIFKSHFYKKESLVKIAKSLGISDSSIRKKKQRGLEKLRSVFTKELAIINQQ